EKTHTGRDCQDQVFGVHTSPAAGNGIPRRHQVIRLPGSGLSLVTRLLDEGGGARPRRSNGHRDGPPPPAATPARWGLSVPSGPCPLVRDGRARIASGQGAGAASPTG